MAGTTHRFTIVGVDEADVKQGLVAFTAPIARALMGMRKGRTTAFRPGPQRMRLRVEQVE
jgi:transcription elongation factor GreB